MEDCDLPTPDPLASFSESITSPYEELKELKAAAAAVGSRNGLSTRRMTSGRVNGLEETNICSKGDPVRCCRASAEVAQLRETVTQQEKRIQMLEKKIDEQQKENERIWAAVNRLALQDTGCDNNGNHRSDRTPGGGARGFTNHDSRFAGASV